MTIQVRGIESGELLTLMAHANEAFLGDPRPEYEEGFRATLPMERYRCAFDGAQMVGTLGAFDLELAVPGATLASAGTTLVSVRGTHRRRGVLRAMMESHLAEVREREEPLAALWASESGIYGRFGYGWAADASGVYVERSHSAFREDVELDATCRRIEADEMPKVLPEIYERLWRERPGHFARDAAWWEHRRLLDLPPERDGGSMLRAVVAERSGRAEGYVLYRTREGWKGSFPDGEVRVVELVGSDPAVRASLWRVAIDIDLTVRTIAWNVPADCELPWLLADPRRANRTTRDGLWVRIAHVPAALEGRSYAADGEVTFDVRDATLAEVAGRYRLEAGPDGARCRRVESDGEVSLDVADLGAALLGGRSLRAMARTGLVEGAADALARADRLLAWDPAPWCPEVF